MTKYFMQGTPLAALERMMMDPSRDGRDSDPEDHGTPEKAPTKDGEQDI